MINRQKVELMSRAAVYEKAEGKKTLKLDSYFDPEAIRVNRMKNILYALVIYVLVLAILSAALSVDGVFETGINTALISVIVLAVGALFAFLYVLFAELIYKYQYENTRNSMREYIHIISGLDKIYEAWDDQHEDTSVNKK